MQYARAGMHIYAPRFPRGRPAPPDPTRPVSEPMTAPRPLLLAYSGGLDTSFLVAWLSRERGFAVHALTVDCGGFQAAERAEIVARAEAFGARSHRFVDARQALYGEVLRWLVIGHVRRGGTYPLCVAAERGLQARALARLAREQGFAAVAHGCTGAGNDQIRFEAALALHGRGLEVHAPIREQSFSRQDALAYLAAQGFPWPASRARYSVNEGLWGVSIGGAETLTSEQALPEEAWLWTRADRRSAGRRIVELGFESGEAVAIDGERLGPVELIERLNDLGGRYGVGRGYHLGDTLLGFKGRIGYEAPAAEILIQAHRELEKLVLTQDQRSVKDSLAELYGQRLHQGLGFEPALRDIEALWASSQARVEGRVRVELDSGRALVIGLDSPHSMLARQGAVYGERPAAGQSSAGAEWLARTLAEPARLWHLAGESTPPAPVPGASPAHPVAVLKEA